MMIIGNIFYFAMCLLLLLFFFKFIQIMVLLNIYGKLNFIFSFSIVVLFIVSFVKYIAFHFLENVYNKTYPKTPLEGLTKVFKEAYITVKQDIIKGFLFSRWIITGKDYL